MSNLQVANTILEQLGNKAIVMLGASQFVGSNDSLQFAIKGSKQASKIVITLASDDTYTIAFWKGRGINIKRVVEVEGVYAECMHKTIEANTGLYTSL